MERIVLLQCGHWFRESGPDGVKESSPRVCTAGSDRNPEPGHRKHPIFGGDQLYPLSPQGMPMVPVVQYLDA